jgi:hypothetical protein
MTRVAPNPFIRRTAGGGAVTLLVLFGPDGLTNVSIQRDSVVGPDVLQVLSEMID